MYSIILFCYKKRESSKLEPVAEWISHNHCDFLCDPLSSLSLCLSARSLWLAALSRLKPYRTRALWMTIPLMTLLSCHDRRTNSRHTLPKPHQDRRRRRFLKGWRNAEYMSSLWLMRETVCKTRESLATTTTTTAVATTTPPPPE